MYNHNKAQQSKNRVHISWDILYTHMHKADHTAQVIRLAPYQPFTLSMAPTNGENLLNLFCLAIAD